MPAVHRSPAPAHAHRTQVPAPHLWALRTHLCCPVVSVPPFISSLFKPHVCLRWFLGLEVCLLRSVCLCVLFSLIYLVVG